jgi:ribosomal protein S18 acetylase RimI-like enzyme
MVTSEAVGREIVIRDCMKKDLPAVSTLAGRLVREHHSSDPERFMIFDSIEEGYAHYLGSEMRNRHAVVLVAARGAEVVGYAYGRIEPRDWNSLREECGVLHDVYVDEAARRRGTASLLVERMVGRLSSLGARRVILMTAAVNTGAQALFENLGFRRTMVEMMRECDDRRGSIPTDGAAGGE